MEAELESHTRDLYTVTQSQRKTKGQIHRQRTEPCHRPNNVKRAPRTEVGM